MFSLDLLVVEKDKQPWLRERLARRIHLCRTEIAYPKRSDDPRHICRPLIALDERPKIVGEFYRWPLARASRTLDVESERRSRQIKHSPAHLGCGSRRQLSAALEIRSGDRDVARRFIQ